MNTIQSTLDRLYKKGLLTRHKVSYAWCYEPKIEKHQLIAQLIKSVTSDFVNDEENSLIAALYTLAMEYGVNALSILTISDHIVTGEETTSEERQNGFTDMVKLAPETGI
ncbi:BlaI/MecI/CopY family transcriptional regulator [Parashewanella hymeniacidonis]|uniref:BlaI/MecI/CopY family transcriptional regulator n=1 Tax=Parashewanella hymeniacidonis TaxID=2807618 RepID=UPI0030840956